MDVRRLSLFLAVVDHGTFTKAAAASFVSQPGLSQAVRELERELGTTLFDRSGRRVSLTAAGEALVPHARAALREIDGAVDAVAAVAGRRTGRVQLAALPTLAADPVARLVGDFRRAYPGIRVELAAPDDPIELLSMVRTGVVELGIGDTPLDAAGLSVDVLGEQELLAVLPPGSPGSSRPDGRMTLRDLAQVPMVVTTRGTSSRGLLEGAFRSEGLELVVAVESAQREALLPLVLAGAGPALLPAPVAETARLLGATVCPTEPTIRRQVAMFHRRDALSPAGEAFRELALGPPP